MPRILNWSLTLSLVAIAILAVFDCREAAAIDKRIYNFQNNYPSGHLEFCPASDLEYYHPTSVAIAKGRVVLDVPQGKTVLFEPGAQVYQAPQLFKKVPATGIDRIGIHYMSMDDNDHSNCDMLMQEIQRFRNIVSMDVKMSDVSDIGLANLKNMPNIRSINAHSSSVTGSCFADLKTLPQLKLLDVGMCALNPKFVDALASIPNLSRLSVRQTRGTDREVISFAKCQKLNCLCIAANPETSDRSMRSVSKLSKLEELDLSGTSVTMNGLRELSNLRLNKLVLPKEHYSQLEDGELRKLFPKTKLVFPQGPDRSTIRMFAPLR